MFKFIRMLKATKRNYRCSTKTALSMILYNYRYNHYKTEAEKKQEQEELLERFKSIF